MMPGAWLLAFVLQTSVFTPMPYRSLDSRIQRLAYDPDQVVPLGVARGFAAVIDLGADQQIESVVVGNSAGWDVTASKRGDNVVVKPLEGATPTNMIVITADRRYVFFLQPSENAGSFVLSFGPAERVPVPLTITSDRPGVTTAFRFRGARALYPTAMRSDGRRTVITWARTTALPAVFAVDNGSEAIVNGRMVGSDYVIEGVASRFVFRSGKQRALAIADKPNRKP